MRGRDASIARLPGSSSQPAHKIEMGVATHDGHCVLPAERCDPDVVGRNRPASALKFQTDSRVVPSGLNSNIKNSTSVEHSLQGPFVRVAVARLRNAESELPGNNDGDRKLRYTRYEFDRFRRPVKKSGKSIRIENQARSSGSICSNSSSMIF